MEYATNDVIFFLSFIFPSSTDGREHFSLKYSQS
jgi:hypothetical protein